MDDLAVITRAVCVSCYSKHLRRFAGCNYAANRELQRVLRDEVAQLRLSTPSACKLDSLQEEASIVAGRLADSLQNLTALKAATWPEVEEWLKQMYASMAYTDMDSATLKQRLELLASSKVKLLFDGLILDMEGKYQTIKDDYIVKMYESCVARPPADFSV